jgi:deoxyribodipyrimidine photo-lyase
MTQAELFQNDARALPAPSRKAALERLRAFTPSMGRHYATKRNFDFGPQDRSNVSGLSPHVRHRLVTEAELVSAALERHGLNGAEKFIQEACWRTYFKGWMEQRPSVWAEYRSGLERDVAALDADGALRRRYETAVSGETGLECFDVWAEELVEHGYLHNHARMWFASIWVYTLDLPWRLGADFFLRHLMDGDPASNTLGWRWVCGLHTRGKTYLARASNINKYTDGRFTMAGYHLAGEAPALDPDLTHPDPAPLQPGDRPDPDAPTLILLHDEDALAEDWGVGALDIQAAAGIDSLAGRSPLEPGEKARAFTDGALDDGLKRAAEAFNVEVHRIDPTDLANTARRAGATQIVTQRPHAGPLRDRLAAQTAALKEAGVTVRALRRDWDRAIHPLSDKGFFKVKKKIPGILSQLGIG